MMLDEASIPVRPDVSAACEFLGLDALYVANEGKLICICEDRTPKRFLPSCAPIRSARTPRASAP